MIHTFTIREEDLDIAFDHEVPLKEFLRSIGCRPPAIGPTFARSLEQIGIKSISESRDQIKCIRTIIVDTIEWGPNRVWAHLPDEDNHE